jgi:hypothetical protein
MSYYDTSYPPSLYGLPSSHDLQLVGTPVGITLTVDYTWNSDGHSATLAFGDGTNVTNTAGAASHTYGIAAVYMATVVSGNARDSAEITLTGAADDAPEQSEFKAVRIDDDDLPTTEEIPVTED